TPAEPEKPVSFYQAVRPILARSCVGCHRPGKLKGKLDLSAYAGFRAGGKTGLAFVAGDPHKSLIIHKVSGDDPAMPSKGEPLSAAEIKTIADWIRQGAGDDSPAVPAPVVVPEGCAAPGPPPPATVPAYRIAPVITALAYSPDGNILAVGGSYEILLHHGDGSGLIASVPSGSPATSA